MNKHGKSRKLVLSKETLRFLEGGLLKGIAGGATYGACGGDISLQADCTQDDTIGCSYGCDTNFECSNGCATGGACTVSC
jgi:hypothetical protein